MSTLAENDTTRKTTHAGAATGWTRMLRLGLRRDRVIAPVTIASFLAIAVISAYAGKDVFDGGETGLVDSMRGNPVYTFFCGEPGDITTGAAFANWEAVLFMVTAAAICLSMMVVRLTRREEEAGRTELLLAAETGSLAPIVATVAQGTIAAAGIGVVSAVPLLTAGATAADVGVVFGQYFFGALIGVAVGLVAAEIASSARAANLGAAAVILGFYLFRGIADMIDVPWLRWLVPVGWIQNMDAFGADRLWPGLLMIPVLGVAVGAAAWIRNHRDLGSGIFARRLGPATGPRLNSLTAVVVRLTATPIWTFAAVVAVYGLVVGAMLNSVGELVTENQMVADAVVGDGSLDQLTPLFISMMIAVMAMAAAAGGVTLVNRMRAEEKSGRAELLLATETSRTRYFVVHGLDAMVGAVIVVVASAAAVTLGSGIVGAGWGDTAHRAFVAGLAQLPPVLLMTAIALALYGFSNRLLGVAWGLVGLSFVCGPFFAAFLGIPDWAQKISPFSHVPAVPVETHGLAVGGGHHAAAGGGPVRRRNGRLEQARHLVPGP